MKTPKLLLAVLIGLFACKEKEKPVETSRLRFETIRYAKTFGIADYDNTQQLFYCNAGDTLWSFQSDKSNNKKPRIVVLSSVFAGFMEALDRRELIVGVDNIKYFNDSALVRRFKDNKIVELGEEGQLNLEALIALKPDILVCSSFLFNDKSIVKRVEANGTKMLYCDNFKEQHPLARAEWIKFFGLICGAYQASDSIFSAVEKNYLNIKSNCVVKGDKPVVMTDAMFQDVWNVPGGLSYTARLIQDAGGTYLFKDKTETYTFPLNLETVLKASAKASVWLNVNTFHSRKEMLEAEPRYNFFKPFVNNRVFNYNKRENPYAGNDFWETGVVRPDLVLKDLSIIIRADENNYNNLYFYTRLD